jgi:hypothetical protein
MNCAAVIAAEPPPPSASHVFDTPVAQNPTTVKSASHSMFCPDAPPYFLSSIEPNPPGGTVACPATRGKRKTSAARSMAISDHHHSLSSCALIHPRFLCTPFHHGIFICCQLWRHSLYCTQQFQFLLPPRSRFPWHLRERWLQSS